MPTDVAAITREHVAAFIEDQLSRHSAATAGVRYSSLRVFFNWLVAEGEVKASPMARMRKPKLPERIVDIPSEVDLKRLLADMAGDGFEDMRDLAIVRTFMSTGARLSEVAGLRFDPDEPLRNDVDLDGRIVRLIGKGDRERVSSLDAKAVRALDRYMRRARRSHPDADTSWLWLGRKGRLTASGISQMVRDRAERLGFKLHPHQLRHYRADRYKAAGMQDGHIMALMGWRDAGMVRRYGAANTTARALEAARRIDSRDEL
jgi:site-specific recombinase XerD